MTKRNPARYIPGIYTITNTVTGTVYVGQAVDIGARWKYHRCDLSRGVHHNVHLVRAWKKYGADSFRFEIAVDLSHVEKRDLRKALNKTEVETLRKFTDVYNLTEAGLALDGFTASPETRLLLSKRHKATWANPEFRARRSEQTKALYADPEWKAARDTAVRDSRRTVESRQKTKQQADALWSDPAHRAEQSERRKANWQDSEYRAQQATSRAAAWLDPAKRQNRIDGLKRAWARRKAAAEALSNPGK